MVDGGEGCNIKVMNPVHCYEETRSAIVILI